MPTADRGLAVSDLTGQAGSFRLGPVSLAVAPGQVLAVLGPSGAGKTMLLETIAGLRPHRSGRITLAGADITALPPEQRRIGLVFQDAALFPHLSVAGNIRFGPKARRQPRRRRHRSAAAPPRDHAAWPPGPRGRCPAANASGSLSPGRWPSSPAY